MKYSICHCVAEINYNARRFQRFMCIISNTAQKVSNGAGDPSVVCFAVIDSNAGGLCSLLMIMA